MADLFTHFWWLLFPLIGMVYGFVGMLQHGRTQDRAMEVLRTYAQQGKEPPPEVLKALSEGSLSPQDTSVGRSTITGAWWTFFVFFALACGFAAGFKQFQGDAQTAFLVVTVVMSVLALGAFTMAIVATFSRRR